MQTDFDSYNLTQKSVKHHYTTQGITMSYYKKNPHSSCEGFTINLSQREYSFQWNSLLDNSTHNMYTLCD